MANYYAPYFVAPQQMQNVQQPQIQDSGFVNIRSEMEARNFPIGYGKSITFKDENAPYIYVKTMGFSQLDSPTFDKFRLVKEEVEAAPVRNDIPYTELKSEIESLKAEIETLKEKMDKPKTVKKEVAKDE